MGGLTPAPGNPISDLPLKKMTAKILEFENPVIIKDTFKTHHCIIFSSFKRFHDLKKVPTHNRNYKTLKAF